MKILFIFIFAFFSLQISASTLEKDIALEQSGPCIKVVEKVSDSSNLKPMISFISKYNKRFWPYLEKLKDQKKVSKDEYLELKKGKDLLRPVPRGINFRSDGGNGTGGGVVVEY